MGHSWMVFGLALGMMAVHRHRMVVGRCRNPGIDVHQCGRKRYRKNQHRYQVATKERQWRCPHEVHQRKMKPGTSSVKSSTGGNLCRFAGRRAVRRRHDLDKVVERGEQIEQMPIIHSTITCPHCGHQAEEIMPTDACQHFYDCPGCATLLRPHQGNCCVFCSFGSVPCPPVQAARENDLTPGQHSPDCA
jgi:hypothetical protein